MRRYEGMVVTKSVPNSTEAQRRRFQPLEGAINFRDVGGYKTTGGREVKWNVLFRSGALSRLTDDDLTMLSSLDIELLVDLRAQSEQEHAPNRLPPKKKPDVVNLPIWPVATTKVERWLLAGGISEYQPKDNEGVPDTPSAMRNFYQSYVRDHRWQWSTLLHRLAGGTTRRALLHCAGGKDRTGVGIAVLLRALGVPQETVIEDYLLTNLVIDRWILEDHPEGVPSFLRSVMAADQSYVEAAFAYIDMVFGSFDNYLREGLNFTDSKREMLCKAYLT